MTADEKAALEPVGTASAYIAAGPRFSSRGKMRASSPGLISLRMGYASSPALDGGRVICGGWGRTTTDRFWAIVMRVGWNDGSMLKAAKSVFDAAPAARGGLAQLGERDNGIVEVRGSRPLSSTSLEVPSPLGRG